MGLTKPPKCAIFIPLDFIESIPEWMLVKSTLTLAQDNPHAYASSTALYGRKGRRPMEIRFTASILEALGTVLRLVNGTHPEIPATEKPVWCNFSFFSLIRATPIRRTKRDEPTHERLGSWMLERTVEFFHRGTMVATVCLVGLKIDGVGDLDSGSFWAVASITYCRSSVRGLNGITPGWRVIELDTTVLHGQ